MIPKKIHYCWFGGKPLPKDAKKCIKSWKKWCKDYEIIEWNEKNYDIHACKYVEQAAKAEKWAFVSDYARFDILYRFGGLYFDVDVELIRNIDEIIRRGSFMGCEQGKSAENSTKIASGLGIAAEAGLPLYKEILDSYDDDIFFFDANRGIALTVVDRVTDIFKRHGYLEEQKIQTVEGVTIYPWDYLCPMNYYSGMITMTDNTFAIHHYNMSWQSLYAKKMKMIERYCRSHFGNKIGAILYKWLSLPIRVTHKTITILKKK